MRTSLLSFPFSFSPHYLVHMEWDRRRIEGFAHRLIARQRFCVTGKAREILITALWEYLERKTPRQHPLFTIDEWAADGSSRLRILAESNDMTVAYAAYEAAVAKWPATRITLRKGAWIVREAPERRG